MKFCKLKIVAGNNKELLKNILQMNQSYIIPWLSRMSPDSSGWFMRVEKVSKNLKEFLKFVLTKLPIRQDEFLIFPRRILPFPFIHPADFFEWENQPNESGFDIVYQSLTRVWFIWRMFSSLSRICKTSGNSEGITFFSIFVYRIIPTNVEPMRTRTYSSGNTSPKERTSWNN